MSFIQLNQNVKRDMCFKAILRRNKPNDLGKNLRRGRCKTETLADKRTPRDRQKSGRTDGQIDRHIDKHLYRQTYRQLYGPRTTDLVWTYRQNIYTNKRKNNYIDK